MTDADPAVKGKDNIEDMNDSGAIWNQEDAFSVNLFDRRSRHFDKGGNTHWSVAWSDLMMTMFILFAVMYIYQLANREWKYGKGPGTTNFSDSGSGVVMNEGVNETIQESFPDIYDLSRKSIPDVAQVELISDRAVRITLTNDLLFETGKADLKEQAKGVLGDVAFVLKQTPYIINVVGHTDNVPIHSAEFPTNWELSAIRACVVARYLSENLGIPGERFFISGHSFHNPLKPNDNATNRAENRRVEIIITRDRPE
ncbi:MAG: flagellar motor protein MotB [Proteobacteria bacterium]|nr:flagellar motor protein MotB [Pseudomonadota bacterium]